MHAETPETLPCVFACAQLGPDGKVGSADIKIGTRTVALQADSLTYAQAENTLTSAQTKAEIQATP